MYVYTPVPDTSTVWALFPLITKYIIVGPAPDDSEKDVTSIFNVTVLPILALGGAHTFPDKDHLFTTSPYNGNISGVLISLFWEFCCDVIPENAIIINIITTMKDMNTIYSCFIIN
ncbi:hypothetical protein [Ferroplasma acidarmanus]|uniref:hypothetical protein n=1 Tax=Ferroplasma acidarmanus TaxID=97393 RepID=UPI000A048642|nr:hypothetical protein [Ferroplasma acidarmanus]